MKDGSNYADQPPPYSQIAGNDDLRSICKRKKKLQISI